MLSGEVASESLFHRVMVTLPDPRGWGPTRQVGPKVMCLVRRWYAVTEGQYGSRWLFAFSGIKINWSICKNRAAQAPPPESLTAQVWGGLRSLGLPI